MGKPIVFARVSPSDRKLVEIACKARGENISVFVRRAVKTELAKLSYLSDQDKKARNSLRAARVGMGELPSPQYF